MVAGTLESLARHSNTLSSIRGIVHTMKTLSAINASPYEHAARSIEAWHQTILKGFAALAYRTGGMTTAMADDNNTGEGLHLYIVFGSDHGLCGSYNEQLADLVSTRLNTDDLKEHRLLCIGARMNGALLDRGLDVDGVLLPPASPDGIGRLAGEIVTRIDKMSHGRSHRHPAVTLGYTQRATENRREPVMSELLPLDSTLLRPVRRWSSRALPDFRMDAGALLAALIRNHIFASVFRASAEAIMTENAARLELMQQAEQSVDDRLLDVQGELRGVRQTEITNELLDVIIGFEALQKGRKHRSEATIRS